MPIKNAARNAEIIAFVEANDWSYQLVADKFKVSRNAVAGLLFRHRHPASTRINSPRGVRNKTGTGHHGCPFYPAYNARNSVAR